MSTASTTSSTTPHVFSDISGLGSMSFPWALQPAMNPIPEATHIMAPPLTSPKQQRSASFATTSTANNISSAAWQPYTSSPSTSPSSTTASASPPPLVHTKAAIEVVLEGPLEEYMEEDEEEEDEDMRMMMMLHGGSSGGSGDSEEDASRPKLEVLATIGSSPSATAAAATLPTTTASAAAAAAAAAQKKAAARGKKAQQAAMRAAAAARGEEEGEEGNGKERPNLSYARLAALAIEDDPRKKCTVGEIYLWIEQRFPYYKSGAPWWKNCIRHNLSMKKCFVRVQGQGGNLWGLDPSFRDDILGDSPTPKSLLRKPRRHSASAAAPGGESGVPVPIAHATPVPRRNSTPASMAAAAAAASALAGGKAAGPAKRKAAAPKNGTKPMKRSNSGKLDRKGSLSVHEEDDAAEAAEAGAEEDEEDFFGGRSLVDASATFAAASCPLSSGAFEDPSALLEDGWLNDMMANIDATHACGGTSSSTRNDTFSPPLRSYTRLLQSTSPVAYMHLPIADEMMHASNFSDPLFRLTPSGHLDTSAHIDWDLPSFA